MNIPANSGADGGRAPLHLTPGLIQDAHSFLSARGLLATASMALDAYVADPQSAIPGIAGK
jgi:hypothetical protein